jgi:hypothetical protein
MPKLHASPSGNALCSPPPAGTISAQIGVSALLGLRGGGKGGSGGGKGGGKGGGGKGGGGEGGSPKEVEAALATARVAVRCLSGLLVARPGFNYTSDILQVGPGSV